jgi:phosphoglycerol transferase MdoB-like AlkP superfamily enzyme
MLPHEPFYLDATGKLIADSILLKNKLSPKNGYINQVNYVNTLLRQLIPLSAKHSERKKIIIIQGDHGYRHYDKSVPKHKVFLNLNSYYFSDKDYSMLYDSISPVNSFRVVLNKYFCQSLPMLKDTSIYLTEGGK